MLGKKMYPFIFNIFSNLRFICSWFVWVCVFNNERMGEGKTMRKRRWASSWQKASLEKSAVSIPHYPTTEQLWDCLSWNQDFDIAVLCSSTVSWASVISYVVSGGSNILLKDDFEHLRQNFSDASSYFSSGWILKYYLLNTDLSNFQLISWWPVYHTYVYLRWKYD